MTDPTPNDIDLLTKEEFLALCPQREHASGPEPLSTSAQAVLDAAFPEYDCEALYSLTQEQHASKIAAAAIRALADQVVPERLLCTRTAEERTLYHEGRLDAAIRFRAEILAIATELEGQ